MKKKTKQPVDYKEGTDAKRAFEEAMKTLFRAPKLATKKKGKD